MIIGAIIVTAFSKRLKGPGLDLKNFGTARKNMQLVVFPSLM